MCELMCVGALQCLECHGSACRLAATCSAGWQHGKCKARCTMGAVLCFMQEKAALKADKDKAEAKYKVAVIDGRQEQVCQEGWSAADHGLKS